MKIKIKIPASFDVDYTKITKTIPCSVQLVDIINNKKEGKFEIQNTCSGYVKIEDKNIANAVITFYKPNIKQPNTVDYDTNHYTDGINGVKNWHWNNTFEMHSENLIVDKVVSDSNGYYTAFIPNGVYDILIQYNGQSELLKNQEITDGIQEEFYYYIKGLIAYKINSTYVMINETARNIRLKLLNQYMHLTDGELIITKDNELIVYKKFNEHDMFALLPGIYDIRIRNDNTQLLYVKNFEFKEDMDFVDGLRQFINENSFILIENKENEEEKLIEEILNDETISPI